MRLHQRIDAFAFTGGHAGDHQVLVRRHAEFAPMHVGDLAQAGQVRGVRGIGDAAGEQVQGQKNGVAHEGSFVAGRCVRNLPVGADGELCLLLRAAASEAGSCRAGKIRCRHANSDAFSTHKSSACAPT